MEKKYSYEDVKEAYQAIIMVGRMKVVSGPFGGISADLQHIRNLKDLNPSAKELYLALLNDDEVNYG